MDINNEGMHRVFVKKKIISTSLIFPGSAVVVNKPKATNGKCN